LTGKRYDVAIIGAGPAGLAAAFDLTLKGFRVKVFDDFIRPGGLLTSTIPGFRINESILETEISEILNSGVDVENGVRVGRDFSFNELLKMGFRAVLIATGTEESVKLGIRDEDKAGVIDSMTFLKEVKLGKSPELGRVVVVVGGGNAAIDTARTAWRLGVERVILVYRRTRLEMPAMSSEIQQGIDEGIEFRFLTNPIRIISDGFRITGIECIEMKLGELDKSGRRKPVAIPGSEFIIEADALLPAIGQIAELSFLKGVPGIEITKGNTIMVDKETLTTGTKGIFAAGDVEMGPSTIADAISQGKKAALHIAQYLEGKPLKPLYKPVSPCTFIEPLCLTDREIEEVVAAKRFKMACVPVGKRQGSFEIVDLGLEQEAARKEAMRCLRCDIAYWEGIQKGF
jgi:NADPH-dependent glutamate synthase beta subunit-like oxidoreductase